MLLANVLSARGCEDSTGMEFLYDVACSAYVLVRAAIWQGRGSARKEILSDAASLFLLRLYRPWLVMFFFHYDESGTAKRGLMVWNWKVFERKFFDV